MVVRSVGAVGAIVAAICLAGASEARADLVYLSSGRTLSVKNVHMDGSQVTLALRGGGEMSFDRNLIERVEPDEVPYPEPPAIAEAQPATPGARVAAGSQGELTLAMLADAPLPAIPREYDALITELAKKHGVDSRLVHAVVTVESAYHPRARSVKGARGLMQLMPDTARQYGVANSYNPTANLDAGIKHLRSLLDRFDLKLAIAAYNAGEAAVQRFGGVPPYRETRDYVSRVLGLAFGPIARQ
jgi:soluble lytic murein transglycosylase-like protein